MRTSTEKPFSLSVLVCLLAAASGYAQTQPAPAQAPKPPDMSSSWDQVITNAVPAAPPDPALLAPPSDKKKSDIDDLLSHFFFESRTTYERYQTNFTGNPTTAGVINAPDTGVFNPAGIPSLSAFQPGANRLYEFLDFGTNGYGSDRVDTHFSIRYNQDLTKVDQGSPAVNPIETFYGNHYYEVLDANVSIHGKPTDGAFAGTTFSFGRLNVYGAELASFDGGSITVDRSKYTLELYGGRRFDFFSDPVQRGIGGANLNLKLNATTSLEFQTLWYIRGSNRVVLRKRWRDRWLFHSYLRAYGGSPVDFSASMVYSSRSGRNTIMGGFFQKLTNNDYTYDYTSDARDLAAKNPLYRVYLGPINRYSQFNVEAHRRILPNLSAGGAIVVRKLNNENDQTPYETSFRDFRFNTQYFPWNKIEILSEYHQRSSDRLSPYPSSTLDALTGTGETAVKDLTTEVSRSFGEGRFALSGGVYYRRISMQDPFFYEENLHQSGVLGSAWVRLDRQTRLFFDYSLDNDFYLFTPDLKNSQVFRIGLNWKY
ncbi:MAG: hypothetical protein KGN84_09785 [Acidobacteriota bacterium]|nr:hypothetical protein [Acidobacteriota bacterium]